MDAPPPRRTIVCYLLVPREGRRTYIGATVDLERRLRQHNGQIRGGARATCGNRPWRVCCYVVGFLEWREALSFEWHWKKRARGLSARLARMHELLGAREHLRVG